MSGSSLASFSLPTSAIGPKITTGLRNPAVRGHGDDKQLALCNTEADGDSRSVGVSEKVWESPVTVSAVD